MKKILFFISSLEDGGAQRVVSIIASKLAQRDYEISVLKYYAGDNLFPLSKDVKVESCQENTGSTSIIKNICHMHNKFEEYDVILSFLAPFNMMAIVANLFNKTKLVVADRNDPSRLPSNKFVRLLRDILYKLADRIVVQTENNQRYFKNNTDIIYNPVAMEEFKGSALSCKKEKIIVSSSRLEKQKNLMLLIESFAQFYKNHDDYSLVIYGEGSQRKELETRIADMGLTEAVKLPGVTKDIFNKLSKAELFILSSNYEGMPNALIEAMCLGLPVISTKVSGATDLIENGVNGMLVDIGDETSLIQTMSSLIDDKTLSESLAKRAVELCKKLDVDKICDEWERVIKNVCNK